jgi:hypothetical protein
MRSALGSPIALPGTQATPLSSSSASQRSTSFAISRSPWRLPNAQEMSGNT